jgi:hypothetical protein
MIDKHKPVKFDEKPSFRHAIACFGDGLGETITPTLDAIAAAGWELVCHPVSDIHDGWLFRTTNRNAKNPQLIADSVMAGTVGKRETGLFILPPKDKTD